MMQNNTIEQILKNKNLVFPKELFSNIEQERIQAIEKKDEIQANLYWFYASVYQVQQGLVSMYQRIKNHDYRDAWDALRKTESRLIFLEQNFSIGTEEEDPYHLLFIKNILQEYRKLFPYEYFICRESVILKEKCNICGQTVSLRKSCNHIPGKLYMGQLCQHEITEQKYLKTKITIDPFDKYEYLLPYESEQMNYNFGLLDALMQNIKSPYDYWYTEITKEKNPAFARIGRNDSCPCGSGKKFKHCCMKQEDRMFFDHYKIKVMNDINNTIEKPLTII